MINKKKFRPYAPASEIVLGDKKFMYLNDDNPEVAYKTDDLTFVAQPLGNRAYNKKHNVVTVPLMMTDLWGIVKQTPNILKELREIPKEYDYCFIGQCHYADRQIFRNLNLRNYLFEENAGGIYSLSPEEKQDEIYLFLTKLAKSRFAFCPRGIGSSSFRAFEALMVGCVPLITGMNDFPFVKPGMEEHLCLMQKDLSHKSIEYFTRAIDNDIDWVKMRTLGMQYWDNFCHHDKLHEYLEGLYG